MLSWTEWRGDVDGSLDVGVLVGYQAEPSALAPLNDVTAYEGIQHRVRTFFTLGETLRFGSARELSLGLHVYAGATYWESRGHARYPEYGIDAFAQVSKVVFDAGGFLRFAWRPHPIVGLHRGGRSVLAARVELPGRHLHRRRWADVRAALIAGPLARRSGASKHETS